MCAEAFSPGNVVAVTSPDNFKGIRAAVVLPKPRWCDGVFVMLADEKAPVRNLCIVESRGDTIRRLADGMDGRGEVGIPAQQ